MVYSARTSFAPWASFVNALSEVVLDPDQNCTGGAINTMGEARMDIHDSTFACESSNTAAFLSGLCAAMTA